MENNEYKKETSDLIDNYRNFQNYYEINNNNQLIGFYIKEKNINFFLIKNNIITNYSLKDSELVKSKYIDLTDEQYIFLNINRKMILDDNYFMLIEFEDFINIGSS